jgi:hypothetical protein
MAFSINNYADGVLYLLETGGHRDLSCAMRVQYLFLVI